MSPVKAAFSPSRQPMWLLAGLLLLALGLYLHGIGDESLWMDELISVDRAKTENLKLLRMRPLSYLPLHLWMKLGSGDAWLRGLNVVFSLGNIVLLYQLAQRLTTRSVALVATLLLVLSPLVINHTQEVRMYALSLTCGLLGSLAFMAMYQQPKLLRIGLWALLRWLAILTTPLNLLLLLPDTVLFGWGFRQRPRYLYRFGVGLLLVGLLWLPWLLEVALSSARFMGGVEAPGVEIGTVGGERDSPTGLAVLTQLGRFTAWPFGRANSDVVYGFYQGYGLMLLALALFAVASLYWPRRHGGPPPQGAAEHRLLWAVAWWVLPLVPMLVASHLSRSLWVDRYLLMTAPYGFIVLAFGLLRLWRWRPVMAFAIASLYAVAVSGGLYRYYTVTDREDWRGLVTWLNQREQAGDMIVWSMNQEVPRALNHYYTGSADIHIIHRGHRYRLGARSEQSAADAWLSQVPQACPQRIWLAYADASPTFVAALAARFQVEDRQTFYGPLDVFLLSACPQPRD